jgi:hypothetical protein
LFVTRTTSLRGYLVARIGGLAAVLALVVGGGTLVTGLVSIMAAKSVTVTTDTAQSTLAGVVYALGFGIVVAPIALAALGPRKRTTGYLFLLGVIVLPELVATALAGVLPVEFTELCALPSALAALRGSLAPDGIDPFRFLRAFVALALFAGVAAVVVRREVVLLEYDREAES